MHIMYTSYNVIICMCVYMYIYTCTYIYIYISNIITMIYDDETITYEGEAGRSCACTSRREPVANNVY